MRNLLSAHFNRLKNDKVFWVGVVVLLGFGIFGPMINYLDFIKTGYTATLDDFFFSYALLIPIPLSAFCSLFLGTEYSDGAMRNKLVVGHSRAMIYLSNLTVCIAAGFLMIAAYAVAVCALGIPLIGGFQSDAATVILCLLDSIFIVAAFSALFTLISMLIQNKAAAAVISVIGVVVLFVCTVSLFNQLSQPEFQQIYTLSSSIEQSGTETVPNPRYLSGIQRELVQGIFDFLPTGQAYYVSSMAPPNTWQIPLYSLFIMILTTVGGIFFFCKKDLK